MKVTDEGVPVGTLISVVKDSIKRAGVSRTSQTKDLQVASVRLILHVVASKTAGRSESTANWPTNSPTLCASDLCRVLREG